MEKTPILNFIVGTVCGLFLLSFGIYCFRKPQEIRNRYLKNFEIDSEFKWYSASTYLRSSPPVYLFEITGIFCALIGLLILIAVAISFFRQTL